MNYRNDRPRTVTEDMVRLIHEISNNECKTYGCIAREMGIPTWVIFRLLGKSRAVCRKYVDPIYNYFKIKYPKINYEELFFVIKEHSTNEGKIIELEYIKE